MLCLRPEALASKGDLVKRDWQTEGVGARARPEGKIVSVTIAGKPVICSRKSNGLLVGRVSPPAVRQGPPRRAASRKPGESGSDEVKSHPFASERGTTGGPKTAPVGRFGISRLLRVR
jgi:hypothetical protein